MPSVETHIEWLTAAGFNIDSSMQQIPVPYLQATLAGLRWAASHFPHGLVGKDYEVKAAYMPTQPLMWNGRPYGGITDDDGTTFNLSRLTDARHQGTVDEAFQVAVHEPVHRLELGLNGVGRAILHDPTRLGLGDDPTILWPRYFPNRRADLERQLSKYATTSEGEIAPEAIRYWAIGQRTPFTEGYMSVLSAMFGPDEKVREDLRSVVGDFERARGGFRHRTFQTLVSIGKNRWAVAARSSAHTSTADTGELIYLRMSDGTFAVGDQHTLVIVGSGVTPRLFEVGAGRKLTAHLGLVPILAGITSDSRPLTELSPVIEALLVGRKAAANEPSTSAGKYSRLTAEGSSTLVDEIDALLVEQPAIIERLGLPVLETTVPVAGVAARSSFTSRGL